MSARTLKLCFCLAASLLLLLVDDLPRSESRSIVQTTPQFKFPWPQGNWEYRQGWHDPGNVALDIGTRGANADKRVLASADGTITDMCIGNKSARVVINHSGTILEYWHLDVTRIAPDIAINQTVVQGQELGVLLSGSWTREQDGPNACGRADQTADSAHLHWVIRGNASFSADGWTIDRSSSTWRRGSEVRDPVECCPYQMLTSTNVPSARVEVNKTGDGEGSVTTYPAGISCGTDCAGGYPLGSYLTLIANPNAGSAFIGWSGACSGASTTCVLSVNGSKVVTANFSSSAKFELRASRLGDGTGSISGGGISCPGNCSEEYTAGTKVTLTATADTGSAFMGWSGDCSGTSACTVTMNQSKSVSANFKKPTAGKFILTVGKAGDGNGWIDALGQGINCSLDCTEEYTSGTTVKLNASPDNYSKFTGWSQACAGTNADCTLTMNDNKLAIANFVSTAEPIPKVNLIAPNATVTSRTPDFVWQAQNFNATYRVEVATVREPGRVLFTAGPFSSSTLCSSENKLCSLTSPRVLSNDNYVWRVFSTNVDNSNTVPSMSDDMSFRVLGAPCTYSAIPTSPTEFGVRGGSGTFKVQTQSHCYWVVQGTQWWLSVSPGSGQGPGTVYYEVKGNCLPTARSANAYLRGLDGQWLDVTIQQVRNPSFSVATYTPSTSFYNVDSGQWKAGDFNGDGREDLVHLTESSYMHPWFSKGDGTFDVRRFDFRPGYNTQSGVWLTGDFDKDGRTDLAHVTDGNWVNFWYSNGDGTFTEKPWQGNPTYRNRPGQWIAGDFDGDGRTDLVHMLQSTYMHTWLAKGNRKWDVKTFYPGDGRYAVYLGHFVPGDFNADGRIDLIHFVGDYIHTWLSEGNGRFNVLPAFTPWANYNFKMGAWPQNWHTGDFDHDGDTDLVHVTGAHYVHQWISKGNGHFDVTFFSPGAYGTDLGGWVAGDYDGDGKTDLLHIVSWYTHPWLSRGGGNFAVSTFCPNIFSYNSKSGRWITADLNGDRKTDLVHLVKDTYVHPWISGVDPSVYVPLSENPFLQGWSAPGAATCTGCEVPANVTVWANTATGLYHCKGQRFYGRTKRGMFITQNQARDIGFRAAYNRICRN